MNRIKISIKLLLIAIGLLLILQIPVFAVTGKSTAVNVRVRKAASTDSEVIELLDENDVVEILGQEGNWYKVNFKGTIGYVSCDFINANGKVEENKSNDDNTQNNEQNNEQNTETNNQQNNDNKVDEDKKEEPVQQEQNTENQPSNTENEQNTETTPEITNKIYKMAETTNVNILPVITSEYIGEVKKGKEVSVIANAGLWVFIKTDDVSGWVRVDKLSTEDVKVENVQKEEPKQEEVKEVEQKAEQKEEPKQEQENTYTLKTMYVKATAVNVRSQSNISSEAIDALEMNSQVKVVGEENGWYKVQLNGKVGYIRQDLLSDTKTEVTSRSNNLDRTAASNQVKEETAKVEQKAEQPKTEQTTQVTVEPAQTQQAATTTSTSSSSGVTGTDIVNYAMQFKGCKYVYGAAGPNSFDCSGFTSYVYKHFGYNLSRSSKDQANNGKAVTGELQLGDILVFSNNGKTVGHVGIYIGNDKFIHASDSSTGVIVSNLSDSWNKKKYWGARRIL